MGLSETSVDAGGTGHVVNMAVSSAVNDLAEGDKTAASGHTENNADAVADVTETETTDVATDDAETLAAAAEAKALAEAREAEEAAKVEADKRARYERAKKVAEREAQKVAERKALQAQARKAEAERQQFATQLTRERAERERLERDIEAFRADPLAHLERFGVNADAIAKKVVEDSSPESKLAKIEARLAEREAAIEKRLREQEEGEKARAQADTIERNRADFVRRSSDADKYPSLARLAEVDSRALVREAESILQEAYQREGVWYTDEDVRDFLETKYSRLMQPSKQKDETAKSVAAAKAIVETNTGTGTQAKTVAGAPRTLTSKANARATAQPSLDEMDDATAKKVMAEMLRQRRRG